MGKKVLLFFLMMVCMCAGVFAALPYPDSNPYGAVRIFHLDSAAGTTVVDALGTENGDAINIADASWVTSGDGLGNALLLNNGDEYIDSNWGAEIEQATPITICFFVRNLTQAGNLLGEETNTEFSFWFYMNGTGTNLVYLLESQGGLDSITTESITAYTLNNPYIHYCIRNNGTNAVNMAIFRNGSLLSTSKGYDATPASEPSNYDVYFNTFNNDGVPASFVGGVYDEILIFETALRVSEINTIYLGNYTGTGGSTGNINVTIDTPINKIGYNLSVLEGIGHNIWINVTTNVSDVIVYDNNCSVNGGYFINNNNFTLKNISAFADGNYNVTVNCSNATHYGLAYLNFTVDITDPVIIPTIQLRDNHTVVYNGTLGFNVNFTDNLEIYSINITFYNGTILFNKSNIGQNNYQLNLTNYTVDETISNNITVKVCDAHTAQSISSVDYLQENNGLKFVQENGFFKDSKWVSIYPKEYGLYAPARTTKLTDRYTFEFNKNVAPALTETFIVESDYFIDIINSKNYCGHLVIPDLNYWVDFENKDTNNCAIKRINNNKVEVSITGLKSKSTTFNSVGELNCINRTYYFGNFNPVFTYTNFVLATSNNTYTLDGTIDQITMGVYNATLIYNHTRYYGGNVLKFNTTAIAPNTNYQNTTDINLFWELTVDDYIYNLTTYNQTIANIFIDNCTLYNTTSLVMYLRKENNDDLINGEIDVTFFLNTAFSTNELNFSFAFNTPANNYSVCIYPNNVVYNVSAIMSYTALENEVRKYYLINVLFSNITQNLTLYNINSSVGEKIYIYVKDKQDNPYSGYYIRTLRYYPDTNTFKTVEIGLTNNDGLALVYLEPYDVFYKFDILDTTGKIVYSSTSDRISQSNYYFYVGDATDYLDNFKVINNIAYNLYYNNASKNVTFSWSDPSGLSTKGCLKVDEKSYYGDIEICDNCTNSASGTVICSLSGNLTNKVFIANGYVDVPGNSPLTIALMEIRTRTTSVFGNLELFMGLILLITLIIAGSFNLVFGLVMMIFGLFVLVQFGFLQVTVVYAFTGIIVLAGILMFKAER